MLHIFEEFTPLVLVYSQPYFKTNMKEYRTSDFEGNKRFEVAIATLWRIGNK